MVGAQAVWLHVKSLAQKTHVTARVLTVKEAQDDTFHHGLAKSWYV